MKRAKKLLLVGVLLSACLTLSGCILDTDMYKLFNGTGHPPKEGAAVVKQEEKINYLPDGTYYKDGYHVADMQAANGPMVVVMLPDNDPIPITNGVSFSMTGSWINISTNYVNGQDEYYVGIMGDIHVANNTTYKYHSVTLYDKFGNVISDMDMTSDYVSDTSILYGGTTPVKFCSFAISEDQLRNIGYFCIDYSNSTTDRGVYIKLNIEDMEIY